MGIIWRGIIHDLHKLLPVEFVAYAKHFYGNEYEKKTAKFDYAWNHHCKHPLGKHHWQYYVLTDSDGTRTLEMKHKEMLEMVADWNGAGLAITGKNNTKQWYEKNKEAIILHYKTRESVEWLIDNG
jgi:hypothetical protein